MRLIWYLVTGVCGLLAALLFFRGLELMLVLPSGIAFVQLFLGFIFAFAAWKAWGKTRGVTDRRRNR